jgi:DNA-binding NtrC family response regulator
MSPIVLVLGKDPLTREVVLYNLNNCGYLAVEFEEYLHAHRALSDVKFDVLIISAGHTYPDEYELLRHAKKLQPGLRTILIDDAPPHEATTPYVDAFVQRPFRMSCVLDALKQVLFHQQQSEPEVTWRGCLPSSTIH